MRKEYKKAYTQQKSNANQRNVGFELSFSEWLALWHWSGKLEERGRGKDKYCMARIGDDGPYSICNVYITQNAKNVSDGNIGKKDTDITRIKKSLSASGLKRPWVAGDKNPMHRADVKAKISAATSGSKHYAARGVKTPLGNFETAKAAAIALDISKSTIEWRARHEKLGFAYIA